MLITLFYVILSTKPFFFLGSKAKLTPLDQLHNEYKHEGKDW